MTNDELSPPVSLTRENLERAVAAATSPDWSTDWVAASRQAIGRAFDIATSEADLIFNELLRRKLITARNEGPANNLHLTGSVVRMRAKFVRNVEGSA